MSYCVEYNPELNNRYPARKVRRPKQTALLIVVILLVVTVSYSIFGGKLLKMFIPGDPQVTVAAFSEFVEQVGSGEPIRQAVYCFFQEIIFGA